MGVTPDDGELYAKHSEELIRFATVLAGPSSAEDVVASAVLRVFSSPRWAEVEERRAYLFKAVLLEARQQYRSTQRRLRREVRAADHNQQTEAETVRPEVLEALLRLTVRQRAVIYLTYWLDLEVQEVARRLNVSQRTCQRELTTARRRMEALLNES